MKRASDAQARMLRLVADHEAQGRTLLLRDPTADTRHGRGRPERRVWLSLEETDRTANTSRFVTLTHHCERRSPLKTTFDACCRNGWLSTLHEKVVGWTGQDYLRGEDNRILYSIDGAMTEEASWTETMREVTLTEDGEITLGRWQEGKLNAPPPAMPTLADTDREAVELAARANRAGYHLVPGTDAAKKQARRLTKQGFGERGWGGSGSTLSLKATALGVVEVLPDQADLA